MKASTFSDILKEWPIERVRRLIATRTEADVKAALENPDGTASDLASLLSPVGSDLLEAMAQRSASLTRRRFGNTLQFYAPLYVSNYCVNCCRYCGFSRHSKVPRRALSIEEALAEAEYLRDEGFRHILLVSGEDPEHVPLPYFEELSALLSDQFASVCIEIYPLDFEGYRRLVRVGVDGLTLYQETYDPRVYENVHPAGPKRDFTGRLQAVELGAAAGMRSVGIGALLGLASRREEMFYVGLHARYLQRHYWRSHISISFPRMQKAAGGIPPQAPVTDSDLVQMICAQRIFLPDVGLVLSTRESAYRRNHLLPLGITRISAASVTEPGGYLDGKPSGAQFEVHDKRSLREMVDTAQALGYDPVFKNWDAAYHS